MATYIPQKAEDSVATTGDLGVPILGVTNEALNTLTSAATGDYSMLATDSKGRLLVAISTIPTTTVTGTVAVTQPVAVTDNGSFLSVDGSVSLIPLTSGGLTTFHLVSAGSTNATNIKGTAGQLYGWFIYNSNAAARKVAFHNASGTPTAGASIYFTLMIPATSGANVFTDTGIPFSTGIAITTVTGLADADAVAVAANDLIINLWFK